MERRVFSCFFVLKGSRREAPISSPSSWPFLPCVNPLAPTYIPPSGDWQGAALEWAALVQCPYGSALRLQLESSLPPQATFLVSKKVKVSKLSLVSLLCLELLKSLVISAHLPGGKCGDQRDDDYVDSAERNPPRGG